MKKSLITESDIQRYKKLAGIPLNESDNHLHELDMNSYAKARDTTDLFPYTQQWEKGPKDPRAIGQKKQRVNNLAGERFMQEFRNKYANAQIVLENIKTGEKFSLEFNDLKFNNNGTSYSLIFNSNNMPVMWVEKQGHKGKRSYYVSDHDFKRTANVLEQNPADLKITDESNALLLQMVDYGV
jgi:hypothetical protein